MEIKSHDDFFYYTMIVLFLFELSYGDIVKKLTEWGYTIGGTAACDTVKKLQKLKIYYN